MIEHACPNSTAVQQQKLLFPVTKREVKNLILKTILIISNNNTRSCIS